MTGTALIATDVSGLAQALAVADDPAQVIDIEAKLDAIERYMRDAGLYDTVQIRPVNEMRMRARWRLGQLLAVMERQKVGGGRGGKLTLSRVGTSYREYLKDIGLDKNRAWEAVRIGTLPEGDLQWAFAHAREQDILNTFAALVDIARPFWYKENRARKHRSIAARANLATEGIGPFPLIYADPPWKFEVYSEKGLERTPDQHYPTLTDDEISNFRVAGKSVNEIATEDAALLLWCTSSNLERALHIMAEWGFTYKASAVWVKDRGGLGLVFRNKHEVLLYGTRGAMPGPQYQPPSVFVHPRGEHSAKPPEIRNEIEKMYPDFDARTRLELFARETVEGWTAYGFEATRDAA